MDSSTHHRDELRVARAAALADAEGFSRVLFAIERLGSGSAGMVATLSEYWPAIRDLARQSPLADEIPRAWRAFHTPLYDLFELMRAARNDALHQGAFARHLTTSCVCLALVLEDALMNGKVYVSDYMVRDVVFAYGWQPLSYVRQNMLEKSISHLPIRVQAADGAREWRLLDDGALAQYLTGGTTTTRKLKLSQTVDSASNAGLALQPAVCVAPTELVESTVPNLSRGPVLVVGATPDQVLGILSAFDVL